MCGQTTAGVKLLLRIFKKIGDSCQEEQASYATMAELIVDNDQIEPCILVGGDGFIFVFFDNQRNDAYGDGFSL